MTYPLLEKAPKDHNSPEFLDFLRDNNVVIMDGATWLVIENCKYHTKEKPHYTAFFVQGLPLGMSIMELQNRFPEFDLLIKAPKRQSVKRFHIHLIKTKEA